MRAALLWVLVTSSGCVIDRSPLAAEEAHDATGVDLDAAGEQLDAASPEDDAALPDDAPRDAPAERDAHTPSDAFTPPDAFFEGDAPMGCGAETCERRDDDCDGLVDESGCATGSEGDCAAHTLDTHVYLVCPAGLSWTESRDTCDRLGYALTEIDSDEENAALADWLPGESWIGLNDRDDEGHVRVARRNAPAFTSWATASRTIRGRRLRARPPERRSGTTSSADETHTFVCEGEIAPR
jgi:hypothetical protein